MKDKPIMDKMGSKRYTQDIRQLLLYHITGFTLQICICYPKYRFYEKAPSNDIIYICSNFNINTHTCYPINIYTCLRKDFLIRSWLELHVCHNV